MGKLIDAQLNSFLDAIKQTSGNIGAAKTIDVTCSFWGGVRGVLEIWEMVPKEKRNNLLERLQKEYKEYLETTLPQLDLLHQFYKGK